MIIKKCILSLSNSNKSKQNSIKMEDNFKKCGTTTLFTLIETDVGKYLVQPETLQKFRIRNWNVCIDALKTYLNNIENGVEMESSNIVIRVSDCLVFCVFKNGVNSDIYICLME